MIMAGASQKKGKTFSECGKQVLSCSFAMVKKLSRPSAHSCDEVVSLLYLVSLRWHLRKISAEKVQEKKNYKHSTCIWHPLLYLTVEATEGIIFCCIVCGSLRIINYGKLHESHYINSEENMLQIYFHLQSVFHDWWLKTRFPRLAIVCTEFKKSDSFLKFYVSILFKRVSELLFFLVLICSITLLFYLAMKGRSHWNSVVRMKLMEMNG